jgi:hypothetical protein
MRVEKRDRRNSSARWQERAKNAFLWLEFRLLCRMSLGQSYAYSKLAHTILNVGEQVFQRIGFHIQLKKLNLA